MMTPRERFLRVTSHPPKWPDRVCCDFPGSGSSGILDEEPYGYRALAEYVGVPDYLDPCPEPKLGYTYMDERILEKFGSDFRHVGAVPGRRSPLEVLPNGYYRDSYGVLWKRAYGISRSYASRPRIPRLHPAPDNEQSIAKLKTLKDIEEYPYWPDTESTKTRQTMEETVREYAKIAKRLHEQTDYVVVGGRGAYSSEGHRVIRGFGPWFRDMKKNPEFFHAFANKLLQIGMDRNAIMLNAIGDYVDCVQAGPGDMGTQQGPMISLEDFREFVSPYQQKSIAQIKKYTKARIRAHMCGSIHLYIRDLAEMGIDLIGQQISPHTYRMEPERLRRDYSNIISFWGGIDTQIVLVSYTPAQIREWVKRVIYALAPGHIVASNHTIPPEVPPENIWLAHEAIEAFSKLVYGK